VAAVPPGVTLSAEGTMRASSASMVNERNE